MPGLRWGEGHPVIDDLPAMQGETFRSDTAEEACGVKCKRCKVMDALLRLLTASELPPERDLAQKFGVNVRTAQRWLRLVREAQRRPS